MAGYGASLAFDEEAVQNLPVGTDRESVAERKKMFRLADMNGNGITSLAECDRLIVSVLAIEGVKIMKPVINRAFHAARDIVPSVGSISPHYVDFHEFRYFLIYLKLYLELFLMFNSMDRKVGGKYSDRRLSYDEFEAAIPMLLQWGLTDDTSEQLESDPQSVYQEIDDNGGGVVLFDEFAHWALWHHIFQLDGSDDGLEEALDVLRKQKPNLCGKDLSSIRASKAKYRADARISGQGCLGGDPSLSGGYDDIPDGGAELAAGRHYPGGLAAWQASFHGAGEDQPGRYRTVAERTHVCTEENVSDGDRVTTLMAGTVIQVEEVTKNREMKRIRARIAEPEGWISLLNIKNGNRWAVRLRGPDGDTKVRAWSESLERVKEADKVYEKTGIPECINGCGQPRFGRYPTCCTHCKGVDGPHARSCVGQGYQPCIHGCNHPQFGKYDTCCVKCNGPDGPHNRGCYEIGSGRRDRRGGGRSNRRGEGNEDNQGAEANGGGRSGGRRRRSRGGDGDDDQGNRGGKGGGRRRRGRGDDGGNETESSESEQEAAPTRSTGRWCVNGCGRAPFRDFPTCCTRCRGDGGPHARDCDRRHQDEAPRRALRTLFYQHKDRNKGLSYNRFKEIMTPLVGEDDIDEVIATVDRDHNGAIDIDEFMDWLWSGYLDSDARNQLAEEFRDS